MPKDAPKSEAEGDTVSVTPHSVSPQATNTTRKVAGEGAGTNGKAPEKTISCVSCRKRKLRCDRSKPKCGTCERLRHECEYPERRKNLGSKRRNMRGLEERLAQVETKLSIGAQPSSTAGPSCFPTIDNDGNAFGEDLDGFLDNGQQSFNAQAGTLPIAVEDPLTQELISLGLQEPLPPQNMIDELHDIYFETFYKVLPMMHKYRYFASLDRAPHMRPPVCLRYAIWTLAASISDKYSCYEDLFYERARRYTEAAEMKNFGETFVTVYHAQAWGLISTYETSKTYFSRSWMSTGRMTRLAQMLGLHRLDGDSSDVKMIILPPRDWIELEERRRTFWVAFHNDRWSSSGTGWPMSIDEKEIWTHLPVSEESFQQGIMQESVSLADALTPEGAQKVSIFGGIVLSAALFGHNFHHLHRIGPNDHPEDTLNGEFWKRHRRMDNVLSNTFLFLPDHLRMPGGLGDMNVVFLHVLIHTSAICLHHAASVTAGRHKLESGTIRQSRSRSLMAAHEIANLLRLIGYIDAPKMNIWIGFALYIAAGVLLEDLKTEEDPHPQSSMNLKFILAVIKLMGDTHFIVKHFLTQLEFDAQSVGIGKPHGLYCAALVCPGGIDELFVWREESLNSTQNATGTNSAQHSTPEGGQPRSSHLDNFPGMGFMPGLNDAREMTPDSFNLPPFARGPTSVLACITPAIQGKNVFKDSSSFANMDSEFRAISGDALANGISGTNPIQFLFRQSKYTIKYPPAPSVSANGMDSLFSQSSGGSTAQDANHSFQTAVGLDPFLGDLDWDSSFV